jgi:hypothetical protein
VRRGLAGVPRLALPPRSTLRRLLQSMQHPHIIHYLDCVMEDNELRVVMEMVRPSVPNPDLPVRGGA